MGAGTVPIGQWLGIGLLAWFGLLGLLIALRLLNRTIWPIGILTDDGVTVVPERLASLAIFVSVIGGYAFYGLTTDLPIVDGRPSLPEIPQSIIALLTGGNTLYLAGKIARRS